MTTQDPKTLIESIPVESDAMALDKHGYPEIFRIPYQFAAAIFNTEDGVTRYIQTLKTEPSDFYHSGTSFSTALSANEAMEAFCKQREDSPYDARGSIYEVSLVFRRMDVQEINLARSNELSQRMINTLISDGFTEDEIKRFVRSQYNKEMDNLTAEDDDVADLKEDDSDEKFLRDAIRHLNTNRTQGKHFRDKFFAAVRKHSITPTAVRGLSTPTLTKYLRLPIRDLGIPEINYPILLQELKKSLGLRDNYSPAIQPDTLLCVLFEDVYEEFLEE